MIKNNQKGATLAVSLLFMVALTSVLAGITVFNRDKMRVDLATVAAREALSVSKAARIHSRNLIADNANLVTDLSITADGFGGGGPQEVSVQDLIDETLLPDSFGRPDGSGNFFNALGQQIRIFIANHPINGDPTLDSTVPTAYVLLESSNKTTPDITQVMIQEIRSNNLSIGAPLYDNNVNISDSCDGEITVAFWDSGCLSENDYDLLIDGEDNNLDTFVAGSLLIPAWKTQIFDSRAMLRFPQPEQTGLQTMLTDLKMAEMNNCDANDDGVIDQNQIQITDADGTTIDLDLCSAQDDIAATNIDNRRAIRNINTIATNSYIANPQGNADEVSWDSGTQTYINYNASTIEPIDIQSEFLTSTGNAYVHNGNLATGELNVDKSIHNIGRAGDLVTASSQINNLADTHTSNSNLINTTSGIPINVQRINVTGTTSGVNNLTANNNITSNTINYQGTNDIVIDGVAAIGDSFEPNSITIMGDSATTPLAGYSAIVGKANTDNLNITGDLNVDDNVTFSYLNTNTITISDDADNLSGTGNARCQGDCPRRPTGEIWQNCQNAADAGITTFSNCMAQY